MRMKYLNGEQIPFFCPDANKSQMNTAMTGNKTFTKGSGGDVDITGWSAMRVNPTAATTYYFNNDSGKTFPIAVGTVELLWLMSTDITSVTFAFGAGTASVQGM